MKKIMQELLDSTNNKSSKESCPKCDLSVEEFNRTNQFGCPNCYTHFNDEILKMLSNFQENTKHEGKKPVSKDKKIKDLEDAKKTLKLKIARAKEFDDYKSAAKLKLELDDLIKKEC